MRIFSWGERTKAAHARRRGMRWAGGGTAAVLTLAALGIGLGAGPAGAASPGAASAFDWNWTYPQPTCTALTVTYPADIPADQANDANVRIKNLDTDATVTLNFHNNQGTWSGEHSFTFADNAAWPGWAHYAVVWTQVGGTNYHWSGSVSCDAAPAPVLPTVTPDPTFAVTKDATCDARGDASLVFEHASVTSGTFNGGVIPNPQDFFSGDYIGAISGDYDLTFTADDGYVFPDGAATFRLAFTMPSGDCAADPAPVPGDPAVDPTPDPVPDPAPVDPTPPVLADDPTQTDPNRPSDPVQAGPTAPVRTEVLADAHAGDPDLGPQVATGGEAVSDHRAVAAGFAVVAAAAAVLALLIGRRRGPRGTRPTR